MTVVERVGDVGALIVGAPQQLWRVMCGWWPVWVVAGVVWLAAWWWARRCRSRDTRRAVWLRISPPLTAGLGEGGQRFGLALAGIVSRLRGRPWRAGQLSCEFVATDEGVRAGIWVPPAVSADALARAVSGAWPGARIDIVRRAPALATDEAGMSARVVLPRQGAWSPIVDPSTARRSVTDADTPDGLGSVLAALADRAPGEIAVAQIVVCAQRGTNGRSVASRAVAVVGEAVIGALRELLDIFAPGPVASRTPHPRGTTARVTGGDPVAEKLLRDTVAKKSARPHLRVTVRVAVTGSASGQARRAAVARIAEGYDPVATLGAGLVSRRVRRPVRRVSERRPGPGFVATVAEMAALWHLPARGGTYGIDTSPARTRATHRALPRLSHHRNTRKDVNR